LDLFIRLNKEGKTILMVTHDYASIAKKPTRTLVCADGKIEDSATNKTMVDFSGLLELND
jgi:cell division transport system ATP-binding protein